MYKIIATEDFINMLRDMPLKYLSLLTHSFVSISKVENEQTSTMLNKSCVEELLEQLRNCELE